GLMRGDLTAARMYFAESLQVAQESGEPRVAVDAAIGLASVALRETDQQEALQRLRQALQWADVRTDVVLPQQCLARLLTLLHPIVTPWHLTRLLAALDGAQHPVAALVSADAFAEPIRRLHTALGPAAFAAAWAEGHALSVEDALAGLFADRMEPASLPPGSDAGTGHPRQRETAGVKPEGEPAGLTPRECELVCLIAAGKNNAEI